MQIQPALLQTFVAVARSGNLTRAAERLHLTVSALSHQIRALEQRLDRRVFERLPRGVRLTAEGQRLFDAVAAPLDELDRALQRYRVPRHDALAISALGSVAAAWLVPRLPRFMAAHPQIEIKLDSDPGLVDFERDAFDAALRFGPGQWPGLRSEFLFDEWMTPVASPELVAREGTPTLDTLERFPLLGDPADRWRQWFERFGGTCPKRFAAGFTETETLQRAAVAGLGIALGRLTMVRPLIEAGLLVRLVPEQLQADWSHYLVWPPRSDNHAGLALFRDWLLAQAQRYRHEAAQGDPG